MTLQTLYDQLRELRLYAFREALRLQQSSSQYSDLAFEDRISLLVETGWTQWREKRIRCNIDIANFPCKHTSKT